MLVDKQGGGESPYNLSDSRMLQNLPRYGKETTESIPSRSAPLVSTQHLRDATTMEWDAVQLVLRVNPPGDFRPHTS